MGKDLKGRELGAGYSQMKNGLYRRTFIDELRKQHAVYGNTLKECRIKYEEHEKEQAAGISSKRITVDTYYTEWLKNTESNGRIKGSTLSQYSILYEKHIKPEFGKRSAKDVKPAMVKAFQRKLIEDGYAPKTINSITNLLHLIFENMYVDEIIMRNPVILREVKPAADAEERTNARALTDEEKKVFMQYAEGSFYYNAIRLLFATGMRSGELRALKWSDYDEKAGVLHIRKTASVDKDGNLAINTPKSKAGFRDFPINEQIKEIISSQKEQCSLFAGKVREFDSIMFPSIEGKVMSRNVLKSAFDTICEHIEKDGKEFDRISPHSCRHTFITDAIHAGVNEYVLKDLVGHSPSAKVTTSVYLERSQNEMKSVMESFTIAI